ncbi:MAG: hypothetical protein IKC65_05620, partial [Lentisphaeria bacterium]|nr:hypothetical protein [Lentisphaeria bacterium]
ASGNKARNINTALWLSQIRFDVYLAEDLFHPDFKASKIMLLGDLSPVQPEMIAKIRKRFLKEGRVLIWLGAPGILSGASLDELSKALGFQLSMPDAVRHKHIFIDRSGDPLLAGVSGFLMTARYHTPLTPYFKASASAPDAKVLGYFQGTEHPGVLCRTSRQGTEIFIGQQGAITPQFLRNIARRVNIAPITSGNDLMIRGGGLIVLGASTGNGVRKIHYPAGVKKLKCLTGQKIENETNHSLEVYLKYGECAVFQCCSKP